MADPQLRPGGLQFCDTLLGNLWAGKSDDTQRGHFDQVFDAVVCDTSSNRKQCQTGVGTQSAQEFIAILAVNHELGYIWRTCNKFS